MIVTTTVTGFDRLLAALQHHARRLAGAARTARRSAPDAAWRDAALLWPGFAPDSSQG